MIKHCIIILLLGITLLNSCTDQESSFDSNEEIWKLGWRMIESDMNGNLEVAELQFDSLLDHSNKLDSHFLGVGLKVKYSLDRSEEVKRILSAQNFDVLSNLCKKEFLSNLVICSKLSKENIDNKVLQVELLKMFIDDQAARGNIMKDVIARYNLSDHEVTKDSGLTVDKINRNRLKEIFSENGFPTKKMVGVTAMHGLFLMIQHSDGDKEWQKDQLIKIQKAVKDGDMNGQSYAYLYDRIKINSGEKQLYGTQFANVDLVNKIAELADTEDLNNLDVRRREFGMMPIEMYKRFMLEN